MPLRGASFLSFSFSGRCGDGVLSGKAAFFSNIWPRSGRRQVHLDLGDQLPGVQGLPRVQERCDLTVAVALGGVRQVDDDLVDVVGQPPKVEVDLLAQLDAGAVPEAREHGQLLLVQERVLDEEGDDGRCHMGAERAGRFGPSPHLGFGFCRIIATGGSSSSAITWRHVVISPCW
ncbi:uncharacterized protein PG986_004290 [Apiospora aurea]|uniref:Uncharacterized protein n=1 Tax=Apiospora aurea TaxID=335848 RepID=A0ABR1QM66_9PEZI